MKSAKQLLKSKLKDRTARIGVIGLGYVGLPFAVEKAKVGFNVTGLDRNPVRVDQINSGENYITDVKDEELRELVHKGKVKAEVGFDSLPEMDAIVICVPTPLDCNLTPDLQYVANVAEEISAASPGAAGFSGIDDLSGHTEEIILPILERSGLKAEKDFFLCHSPERVDPGNKRYTTGNTSKVIGGIGPESLEVGVAFYEETIQNVVPVSSARAAELVKVYENTFRQSTSPW